MPRSSKGWNTVPVNGQIDMNFRWGFPQGCKVKWLKIISLLFGIWKIRKHIFPMKLSLVIDLGFVNMYMSISLSCILPREWGECGRGRSMIQIYEGVGYWGSPLGWVGWRRGGITTFPLLLITLSFYCDNKGYSFGIFGVWGDFWPATCWTK